MIATTKEKNSYIVCPLCSRGKLIFENENANDVQIRVIKPDDQKKSRWFIKCPVCKGQVGLALNA